jgi:hypothetical protein
LAYPAIPSLLDIGAFRPSARVDHQAKQGWYIRIPTQTQIALLNNSASAAIPAQRRGVILIISFEHVLFPQFEVRLDKVLEAPCSAEFRRSLRPPIFMKFREYCAEDVCRAQSA